MSDPVGTTARILIIDDDADVLAATSRTCKKAGYDVLQARSGEEGIGIALREIPDLVILDVVLEGEDGIEICRRIKAEPTLRNVYVVMTFGKRLSTKEAAAGLEAGAVEYLQRPFHNAEFLSRLRTVLRLQEAESRASASAEHFRTTLASIGDGVISTDTDGRVTGLNAGAESLTGWTEANAMGQPLSNVFRIVDESTRKTVESPIAHALREGGVVGLANHTLLLARDGREIAIADSAAPIRNSNGDVTGVVLVFRDQTEERAAERALRASHEKLREAQFLAAIGSFTWEIETGCVTWSEGMYRLLRYEPDDAIDMSTVNKAIHHPDDLERVTAWLTQGIQSNADRLEPNEYRLIRKDGSIITVRTHVRLERENGEAKWLFGTCQDITDRVQAAESLRRAQELSDRLVEDGPVGIVKVNCGGEIVFANRHAEQLFGLQKADIQGRSYNAPDWQITSVDGSPFPDEELPFRRVMATGRAVYDVQHAIIRKDGVRLILSINGAPVHDAQGQIEGIVFAILDVSLRAEHEANLQKIAWLLDKEADSCCASRLPYYGDVTQLNTERTIRDSIGPERLEAISTDIMKLLDTSIAVYEKNGDYAYGCFVSEWCSLMDGASRRLCHTNDNEEALSCGRWLCHENCWNQSAKAAIESGEPTDIACVGGIRLYCVPIYADKEIVGAINIGYGNPPNDDRSLRELADAFGTDIEALVEAARAFKPRPEFLINAAKARLSLVAEQIGQMVEIQQAQGSLRESEARLHLAMESASEGVWEWNFTTGQVTFDDVALRMVGYEADFPSQPGVWWIAQIHDEDRPAVEEAFAAFLEGETETYAREFRLATKNGGYVWVASTARTVRSDEQGKPLLVVGIHRDITLAKQTETKLRESEAELRAVLDSTPFPVAVVDSDDHDIRFWSQSAKALFGHIAPTAPEWYEIAYPDPAYRDEVIRRWKAALAIARDTGQPVNAGEFEVTCADGSTRQCELHAAFVRDNLVVTFRDVTARRKMERASEASEARYARLAANMPGVAFQNLQYDDDPTHDEFPYISPGVQDLFGLTPEDVLRDSGTIWSAIYPDDIVELNDMIRRAVETGTHWNHDFRIVTTDGETKWVRGMASHERQPDGSIFWDGLLLDITERKRAERQFLHLNRVLRAIRNVNQLITQEKDRDALLRGVCRSLVDARGYASAWLALQSEAGELVFAAESGAGGSFAAFRTELEQGKWPLCARRALAEPDDIVVIPTPETYCGCCPLAGTYRGTAVMVGALRHGNSDYGVLAVALTQELVNDDEERSLFKELAGDVAYALHAMETEQERQRTQERLDDAVLQFREAVRGGNVGFWDWDLTTDTVRFSAEWKAQIGYGEDEIGDQFEEWRSRVHPDDLAAALRTVERAIEERRATWTTEFRFRHRDGSWRWISANASIVTDGSGKPVRAVGSHVDVTERKQAEEAMRENEARFRTLFADSVAPVLNTLVDGTIEDANPACEDLLGVARNGLSGANLLDFYANPEDRLEFKRTIDAKGSVKDYPLLFKKKDGTPIQCLATVRVHWSEDGSRIVGYRGTLRDVTREQELQNQLNQALKLESVGRLAGGVAHDFNNLLMGIMNYAEMCRDRLPEDHETRPWIDEITREAERSANLTRQLLAFARKQTIAPRVLDLNEAVEGMLKMLRRLIGEDIDLLWQPGKGLRQVCMDPGQIDQLLANLCVNARDAIGGVGKVTIETRNAAVDADYCASHSEAREGKFVVLAVSDDGCGMSADTLEHVFEPFFTTKEQGEGTGLGLSTIYGIVKQNEGFINVYSEPGKGTTFRIYLPRSEAAGETEAVAAGVSTRTGGTETILLVEDEKSIRVTAALFLKDLGYEVLTAETPEVALRVEGEHGGSIDLLVTDVVMPGMSGRELAETLQAKYPSLSVLYMSGYTANVIAHRGILEQGTHFLSKPITRDTLARKVREILDGD